MTEVVLQIKNLSIEFGGLKAVANLDLELNRGSIFGLIGPNGAGKTTVFNMLTGVYQPTAGTIRAFEKNLVGQKPFQITRCGLARTFQNIRLFKNLSVLQNILVALDNNPKQTPTHLLPSLLRTESVCRDERNKIKAAQHILEVFQLHDQEHQLACNLPYGHQRRLEMARALATGAKILLLDEPAAGMHSQETESIMNMIRFVRDEFGVTILLIEHDMKLVMGICERIAVLDYGIKIAEGTPAEIQRNAKVIAAYLGSS